MPEAAASKTVPPYLPFKTFLNSLDTLSHGVPPKIDRTLWRTMSGGDQGLIMNAYRFFGLIEDDDSSNEYLERLAKHPDQRPTALRELINIQYEDIIRADTTKMTMKMLETAFDEYFGVSGATKQKAITFFLKAAQFADIPLSPYLLTQLRNTGPRKKRAKKTAPVFAHEANSYGAPSIQPISPNTNPRAETHSVRLTGGGTVTLSVDAKMFTAPKEDGDFVAALVELVQGYEKRHPLANAAEEDEEEEG